MIARTRLDQKGSLNAIWYEYLSVRVPLSNTKNAAKPDTSVGHTLLNSRFYDSWRGQFLSEDPVFWEIGLTQDGKAALSNPQAQNGYGYANDNPVVNKDTLGRFALGLGLTGEGNVPGLHGETSRMAVLTIGTQPFNVEFGVMKSLGGGGTTGVLGLSVAGQFMFSPDAQSIKDLKGVDVSAGGSVKFGADIGFDVGLSRSDKSSKPAVSYTGSLGLGGVATPYALPVEFHGGLDYSKPVLQFNITSTLTDIKNSIRSGAQNTCSYIQSQINSISHQIELIKNQTGQSANQNKSNN
jgi:RHS repeat-associated protein